MGFPVMGVWQDNMAGDDINGIHRSHAGRHVLYADDFGTIRLLNYPCVVDKVEGGVNCLSSLGHASHVPNVRWLADDRRAISVGGSDCSLFQWRLVENPDVRPDPRTGLRDVVGWPDADEGVVTKGGEDVGTDAGVRRRAARRNAEVAGQTGNLQVRPSRCDSTLLNSVVIRRDL
jgi:hypothetical protein